MSVIRGIFCFAFARVLMLLATTFMATEAQVANPVAKCDSTGPLCQRNTSCTELPTNSYQWCGSCELYLRCQDGVGTIYENLNLIYPYWDDHKKSFQSTSTTCTECYFPCPPESEVPPIGGPGSDCELTGPDCVPSTAFCGTLLQVRQFQHCRNCRTYVNCAGFSGSSIETCPGNTFWDDVAKECLDASTTCTECYTPCNETITEAPTTIAEVGPTTAEDGDGKEEIEIDNTTAEDGDGKEEIEIDNTTERPGGGSEALVLSTNILMFNFLMQFGFRLYYAQEHRV